MVYTYRFDLICLVLDKPDEKTYQHFASHLVALNYEENEVWNYIYYLGWFDMILGGHYSNLHD